MLNLFASKISNLTDARFFAAYMPQYMSMPLPDFEPEAIKRFVTIKEWIEGVFWAAEVYKTFDEQSLITLNQIGVDTVIIQANNFLQAPLPSQIKAVLSISEEDLFWARTADFSLYTQIILPPGSDLGLIKDLQARVDIPIWCRVEKLKNWNTLLPMIELIEGVVVEGGDEEKVGYKSFDDKSMLLEEILGAD